MPYTLQDASGGLWVITVTNQGYLGLAPSSDAPVSLILNDSGGNSWSIVLVLTGTEPELKAVSTTNGSYPTAVSVVSAGGVGFSLSVTTSGYVRTDPVGRKSLGADAVLVRNPGPGFAKLEIWRTGDADWSDYSAYLWSDGTQLAKKTHKQTNPQTFMVNLTDGVPGLVVPECGNRIRFSLAAYGVWFLGYISSIPVLTPLAGRDVFVPIYGYVITAVSEEMKLEWKTSATFPTLAPYLNKTQGYITGAIITVLGGGFGNAKVRDGIRMPFFRAAPDEAFMDSIRRLTDNTNMKFWTKNGEALLAPYDDADVGYVPTEEDARFDPMSLNITPVQNPVFNDVIAVLQDKREPQAYVTEYFVGDGLTAAFLLKFPLFGATSSQLLQDNFTSTPISSTNWILTADRDTFSLLSITAGSLRMFTPTGVTAPSWLTSVNGLQIEGTLALRAGRVRFDGPSNAIIGGVYGADTGKLVDCVAGFLATPSGAQTLIRPVVNGAAQQPSYLTKANKSYQFTLTIDSEDAVRARRPFFSLFNKFGGDSRGGAPFASPAFSTKFNTAAPGDGMGASVSFSLVEIDDLDADAAAVEVFTYSVDYSSIGLDLFYTLLAGPTNSTDTVNLSLNFCLLQNPVQAQLWTTGVAIVATDNFDRDVTEVDAYFTSTLGSSWDTNGTALQIEIQVGLVQDVQPSVPNLLCSGRWLLNPRFAPDQSSSVIITAIGADQVGPAARMADDGSPNFYCALADSGNLKLYSVVAETQSLLGSHAFPLPGVSVGDRIEIRCVGTTITALWNGIVVITATDANIATGQPGVVAFSTTVGVATVSTSRANFWSCGTAGGWQRQRLTDQQDPLADAAVNSTNDGNYQLIFVSLRQPNQGELIRISYRSAGVPRARVQLDTSIAAEALKSGDDGIRTGTLPTITPPPRDAQEAEWACQAYIDDHTTPQYQGDWTLYSNAYPPTIEPVPGRFLQVRALTRYAPFRALVTMVENSLINVQPDGTELLMTKLTFGPLLRLDRESERFAPADEALIGQLDSLVAVTPVPFDQVGSSNGPDVKQLAYVSRTPTTLVLDAGAPPASSYEVRKTDLAWGTPSTLNSALPDQATEQFTVPRSGNDITVMIKNKTAGGLVSRYPAAIRFCWPRVPNQLQVSTVDRSDPSQPELNFIYTGLLSDVFALEVRLADDVTVISPPGGIPIVFPTDLFYQYDNSVNPLTEVTLNFYAVNALGEYSPGLEVILDLVSGQFAEFTSAPDVLPNPGFENSSADYSNAFEAGAAQYLSDNWAASSDSSPQYALGVFSTDVPRSGRSNGMIRLPESTVIPSGVTIDAALQSPCPVPFPKITITRVGVPSVHLSFAKPFPVTGNQALIFGGWAAWNGVASPAGVSGSVGFRLKFYDADLNFIESSPVDNPLSAELGGYSFLTGAKAAPPNAAFVVFEAYATLTNASGSDFNTGANLYQDARFDDCFMEIANRGSHSSYQLLSNPLTAHDDGSSCSINIADFEIRSGSTTAEVVGSPIHALAYAQLWYVYYDDPTFSGGAVEFNATQVKDVAMAGDFRFFVGSILTPIPGGQDTVGNGDGGAGAQVGMVNELTMSANTASNQFGTGAIANPQYSIDGDPTTFVVLTASGNGSANNLDLTIAGPPGISRAYSSLKLKIDASMPVNNLGVSSGGPQIVYSIDGGVTFNLISQFHPLPNATVARQSVMINLPLTQNIALVQVRALMGTGAPLFGYASGGSAEIDLYGVSIIATE